MEVRSSWETASTPAAARSASTPCLPQNDPKLRPIRQPSYPSLAIEILSSEGNCLIKSTRTALYQVLGLRSSAWAVLGKRGRLCSYGQLIAEKQVTARHRIRLPGPRMVAEDVGILDPCR